MRKVSATTNARSEVGKAYVSDADKIDSGRHNSGPWPRSLLSDSASLAAADNWGLVVSAPFQSASASQGDPREPQHPLTDMREKLAFDPATGISRLTFSRFPPEEGLVEGTEQHVISHLTRFHAKERAQLQAMREERRRFARDIHDGILQVLTGAAMQLEAASQLIESDPTTARACIRAVCDLIAVEQRDLRILIRKTEPAGEESSVSISELAAVLEKIRERIGKAWSLSIELTIGGHGHVSFAVSEDVYNVVQEALTNVARHAKARIARVSLVLVRDRVSITVSDDGCGFPFHGRFDLPALIARDLGPVSLRERVAARRGSMVLVSSLSGSSLEMSLSLRPDL